MPCMMLRDILDVNPTSMRPISRSGMMEELWVFLYEHGYIMIQDVYLLQKWIDALVAIGSLCLALTSSCISL